MTSHEHLQERARPIRLRKNHRFLTGDSLISCYQSDSLVVFVVMSFTDLGAGVFRFVAWLRSPNGFSNHLFNDLTPNGLKLMHIHILFSDYTSNDVSQRWSGENVVHVESFFILSRSVISLYPCFSWFSMLFTGRVGEATEVLYGVVVLKCYGYIHGP